MAPNSSGAVENSVTVAIWYTPDESRGVGVLVATGMLSLLSVVGLLAIMVISAIRSFRSPEKNGFIRTHVAAYFFSLLLCDLAQSIGGVWNARWITQGGVQVGPYCTAQAVIKQTGNVGTALWNVVIAVHTFNVLFFRWHIADYVCYGTLVGVWSLLGLIVILGTAVVETQERGPFYGVSGYWCWITSQYPVERYTLEYLFMFSSAGLSFILYFLVFLRLRGNVSVSGWHIRFHHIRKGPGQDNSNNGTFHDGGRDPVRMQVARQMLWYPVAYTILVLPIAAARFSAFNGKVVPLAVTIFTAGLFMLDGFVNALLFTATRRVIQLPPNWKISHFTLSRRSHDSERGPITGPYMSTATATMTQVDEPDNPTARAPGTPDTQAPLASISRASLNPSYPPLTPPPSQRNAHGGGLSTTQPASSLSPLQGKRPQWVGHGRSGSEGSARSSSSLSTLTLRWDPTGFSGTPLVKNASADGRGGYLPTYGRERSGSEGSIRHQAGHVAAPGNSSSPRGIHKPLPSLPTEDQ